MLMKEMMVAGCQVQTSCFMLGIEQLTSNTIILT